ncbi:NirD/YgiW/YdeI family stress tolerance protein [Erwinia sp. MMLR14_017]|uniref:NirD/YgiW/YdeI family stress tolerance protein n=1 Tax=Erwinia sp. MMLR14_017 TaxID=3093842 RepID=UPI00298F5A41|nr:NirD/YgiW/YdeI family stress tolerance protein [Erwinia sp. MMLR14_017]MDW8845371.1 NirD/YgiW/YdeI family stress tolerance protein [Erwinia sp. MMLR14_017]
MKKTLWIMLALLCSSSAFARQEVTVAEAKEMHDDRHVAITGTISGRADDDNYWLQDSTGRIRIDVDDDDDDDNYLVGKKVRISGEIDHNNGRTEIDVDRVYILK